MAPPRPPRPTTWRSKSSASAIAAAATATLLLLLLLLLKTGDRASAAITSSSSSPRTSSAAASVSLHAKWQAAPLVLEAVEFLAEESPAALWRFAEREWSPSPFENSTSGSKEEEEEHAAAPSSASCWAALLGAAARALSPSSSSTSASAPSSLLRPFALSLAARQYAARVELTRSVMEEDGVSSSSSSCCVARVGGGGAKGGVVTTAVDEASLAAALREALSGGAAEETSPLSPEIYDFDHIYPPGEGEQEEGGESGDDADDDADGPRQSRPKKTISAVLYAAPGSPCFSSMHALLARAARDSSSSSSSSRRRSSAKGRRKLVYAWRPALPSPSCLSQSGCLSLGAGGRVPLAGFGAEFALKSTEYLAVDDKKEGDGKGEKGKESSEEKTKKKGGAAAAAAASAVVAGLDFAKLSSRLSGSSSALSSALDALRERLLSTGAPSAAEAREAARALAAASGATTIKAWDLRDLDLQAAARARADPVDPLRALAREAASFPASARTLLRVTVPQELRDAASTAALDGGGGESGGGGSSSRVFMPGANMLLVNGLALFDSASNSAAAASSSGGGDKGSVPPPPPLELADTLDAVRAELRLADAVAEAVPGLRLAAASNSEENDSDLLLLKVLATRSEVGLDDGAGAVMGGPSATRLDLLATLMPASKKQKEGSSKSKEKKKPGGKETKAAAAAAQGPGLVFANDLEVDEEYSRAPSSLVAGLMGGNMMGMMMGGGMGGRQQQFPQLGLNALTLVLALDPCDRGALTLAAAASAAVSRRWPLRVALALLPRDAVRRAASSSSKMSNPAAPPPYPPFSECGDCERIARAVAALSGHPVKKKKTTKEEKSAAAVVAVSGGGSLGLDALARLATPPPPRKAASSSSSSSSSVPSSRPPPPTWPEFKRAVAAAWEADPATRRRRTGHASAAAALAALEGEGEGGSASSDAAAAETLGSAARGALAAGIVSGGDDDGDDNEAAAEKASAAVARGWLNGAPLPTLATPEGRAASFAEVSADDASRLLAYALQAEIQQVTAWAFYGQLRDEEEDDDDDDDQDDDDDDDEEDSDDDGGDGGLNVDEDGTELLRRILSLAGARPRANPRATDRALTVSEAAEKEKKRAKKSAGSAAADDLLPPPVQRRLAGPASPAAAPFSSLRYSSTSSSSSSSSPSSSPRPALFTHWVATDVSSAAGRRLAREALRHLLEGEEEDAGAAAAEEEKRRKKKEAAEPGAVPEPPPPVPRASRSRVALLHCGGGASSSASSPLSRLLLAASKLELPGLERARLLHSLLGEDVAAAAAAAAADGSGDVGSALLPSLLSPSLSKQLSSSLSSSSNRNDELDEELQLHSRACSRALGLRRGERAVVTNGRVLVDGRRKSKRRSEKGKTKTKTSAAAAAAAGDAPSPSPSSPSTIVAEDLHLLEAHSDAGKLAGAVAEALRGLKPPPPPRDAKAKKAKEANDASSFLSDAVAAATAELLAAPPNPVAAAGLRGAMAVDAVEGALARGSKHVFDAAAVTPSANKKKKSFSSPISITAVVDPLSPAAQRLAPLLLSLRASLRPARMTVFLNPTPELTALPLTTFYAAALPRFREVVVEGDENGEGGNPLSPPPPSSASSSSSSSAAAASLLPPPPPLGEPLPAVAVADGLPADKILTLNLVVPEAWLAEAVDAGSADLDNLVLSQLPEVEEGEPAADAEFPEASTATAVSTATQATDSPLRLAADFELEALLLTGSCVDIAARTRDAVTPRGVQLQLLTRRKREGGGEGGGEEKSDDDEGTSSSPSNSSSSFSTVSADTLVMSNLGYFQLQARSPRLWKLALAPGRSSALYEVDPSTGSGDGRALGGALMTAKEEEEEEEEGTTAAAAASGGGDVVVGKKGVTVALDSFSGRHVSLRLRKKRGFEKSDVLGTDDVGVASVAVGGGGKSWPGLSSLLKPSSSSSKGLNTSDPRHNRIGDFSLSAEDDPSCVHVFTVASGHMYERLQKIMIASVLRHSRRRVKFWFIKNYMSPSARAVLPEIAQKWGFEYQFVTYRWPHWLRAQSEKQRVIWGYKILFLDVLFPLNLKKVIFADSDQIVRADFAELWDMDLKGAPLAYAPLCDGNAAMDGFRFWKAGFWAGHLRGKPYHISALYVVDLARFRETAAGDRLRVIYDQLSRDPHSLANLDQDLPNYAQHQVPIYSLPTEWLWCETWCSGEAKVKSSAKTIDLCNNPMTKEPKLEAARRIAPEWVAYDDEARAATLEAEEELAREKEEKEKERKEGRKKTCGCGRGGDHDHHHDDHDEEKEQLPSSSSSSSASSSAPKHDATEL